MRIRKPLSVGLVTTLSLILVSCGGTSTPMPVTQPTAESSLTEQQTATLSSLEKVDDYPLYTMHYYGSSADGISFSTDSNPSSIWGCSLFAAMGGEDKFYGRNFDWEMSPALLLFNHPTDGYDSVSMVDIAYLIGNNADALTDLPIEQRLALLDAPALPFDGMNERGLAVGMAAVPSAEMKIDPANETIDSLMVIRKMLDQAEDVDEAVAILRSYNIEWGSGPPLHYLIADRSGRAVLAEFYQGELRLLPNDQPWHLATNFLRSAVSGSPNGQCSRYDRLEQGLSSVGGEINSTDAMDLLSEVSQPSTQWSVVYGINTGDVIVSMGRQYDKIHEFNIIQSNQASTAAPTADSELSAYAFPESIDPTAKYLFYLHGRIVEDQGIHAVSPDFGEYQHMAILEKFSSHGFAVISERRPKNADSMKSAERVVGQVKALLDAGVPAKNITVVGASKGAAITIEVSHLLENEEVNFVIMSICYPDTVAEFMRNGTSLYGNVLSVYDFADTEYAGSCKKLFEYSEGRGLARHDEIMLQVGTGHGILYQPLDEWVIPVVEWAN
ncbi:partial Penicillin acylase, partial [Anaerolineales bacterium]